MSGNTFGRMFRLTTYGESHGPGLGGVIDGCPPGVFLDEATLQRDLDRRKPGQGAASTARTEADRVRILSGVFEGLTTGTPIAFHIDNTDHRSRDYSKIKDVYRPGHADMTYDAKYGLRDYRGGGRASGRETAARVAGGAVACAVLARIGCEVRAFPIELGGVAAAPTDLAGIHERPFFAPDPQVVPLWEERVAEVRKSGDTLGGVVRVMAIGVPPGLGDPVFEKLDARLAFAMMGVGAVKGVGVGAGFGAAQALGSENNDQVRAGGFVSNHAGGILGGISSGQDILLDVAVKPIPSLGKPQLALCRGGECREVTIGGRHDISAIPRIVPVLRAMALLTLADAYLTQRGQCGEAARAPLPKKAAGLDESGGIHEED